MPRAGDTPAVTSVTGTTEVEQVGVAEPIAAPAPTTGTTTSPESAAGERPQERQDWYRAVRSVRTRILAAYVVLIAISAAVAIVGIRSLLHSQLEERVQEALEQEVREFDLLVRGVDPRTGEAFTSVQAVFKVYLDRNVPSQEEGILTFVDGRQFNRQILGQFPLDRMPSEQLADWESRSRRERASQSASCSEGMRSSGNWPRICRLNCRPLTKVRIPSSWLGTFRSR